MDSIPPEYPVAVGFGYGGERPSPTRRELQGPRPSPLRVNKGSHKIRKPPIAPPHPPPPHAAAAAAPNPQPVIIYAVSPKVIHTSVSDFMAVVQRFTGPDSAAARSGSGTLSPAARLASIQKLSPPAAAEIEVSGSSEVLEIIGDSAVEIGKNPGILSPSPACLLPIPTPELFSPASDPLMFFNNNGFSPNTSALFNAPLISPSPSSLDFFNPFFDF